LKLKNFILDIFEKKQKIKKCLVGSGGIAKISTPTSKFLALHFFLEWALAGRSSVLGASGVYRGVYLDHYGPRFSKTIFAEHGPKITLFVICFSTCKILKVCSKIVKFSIETFEKKILPHKVLRSS
jgi:hypothetical protein